MGHQSRLNHQTKMKKAGPVVKYPFFFCDACALTLIGDMKQDYILLFRVQAGISSLHPDSKSGFNFYIEENITKFCCG